MRQKKRRQQESSFLDRDRDRERMPSSHTYDIGSSHALPTSRGRADDVQPRHGRTDLVSRCDAREEREKQLDRHPRTRIASRTYCTVHVLCTYYCGVQ